jgi:hypothetical protein
MSQKFTSLSFDSQEHGIRGLTNLCLVGKAVNFVNEHVKLDVGVVLQKIHKTMITI